jgi:hypothetical protein
VRHQYVHQHEVRLIADDAIDGIASIGGELDDVAVTGEEGRNKPAIRFDIVDDEDATGGGTGGFRRPTGLSRSNCRIPARSDDALLAALTRLGGT